MRDSGHRGNPVDELVGGDYLALSERAVELVRQRSVDVLRALGLRPDNGASLLDLAERSGVRADRRQAFAWLVREGVESTELSIAGNVFRFPERKEPRVDGENVTHDDALEPTRNLVDACAERYVDFLRGRRSGMAILFAGKPALERWRRFFSPDNALYHVHNRLAARAVARFASELHRGASILELGTGTGGASHAILRELQLARSGEGVDRLVLTDVARGLLRATCDRARARWGHDAVDHRTLDFTVDLEPQGIRPGDFDVIVAVNALHNAADLPRTLRTIRRVLGPGGVLVVSESICGLDDHVHQDFVFNLLPAGETSDGNEAYRGSIRFLDAARWQQAFAGAGWPAEIHVNSRGPQLALLAMARVPSS